MQKENIDRNIYYGLRKEFGEYTRKSNLPIEVVYSLFETFDREMKKYVVENEEKVKEFIKKN